MKKSAFWLICNAYLLTLFIPVQIRGEDNGIVEESDRVTGQEDIDSSGSPYLEASGSETPLCRLRLLENFSSKLDTAYGELKPSKELQSVYTYKKAKASISAAELLLNDRPGSFRAVSAFDICSILTEAALIHIKTEIDFHNAYILNEENDSLLSELYNIQNTINGLERSYITLLEEKLDYTQQTLDMERETAKRMMEEAQARFSELQSEIINVSEDARGTIISMSDILFDVGKAELTPEFKTSLARIAGILLIYRDANIIVEGHTDDAGSNEFNMELSQKRAENVKGFLINQGISKERLTAEGYGFHRPVADNSTEEGRQKNRRVDLVIQDSRF